MLHVPIEFAIYWTSDGATAEEQISQLLQPGQRVNSLKLIDMNGSEALSPELVSFLREHGVQSLRIESLKSFSHDILSQLLGMMPNLRDIYIKGLQTIGGQMQGNQQHQPFNSHKLKLKSIKLINSTCEILPHFDSQQIETLWIAIVSYVQSVPGTL